jgi:hypothetical protein
MSKLQLRFKLGDTSVRERQKSGIKRAWERRYNETVPRLEEEQLAACRLDPAWEARNGIIDRVVCRICGCLVKTPLHNQLGHLRKRHPGTSTTDYLKQYPAAPLASIKDMAKFYGKRERTPDEVLAQRLSEFVTPEEREECRRDPSWEKLHGIVDFVICRHCGFKSRSELRDDRSGCHLNTHYLTKKQYMELYPEAPWRPEARAVLQRNLGEKWRKRQQEIRAKMAKISVGRRAVRADICAQALKLRSNQPPVVWSKIVWQLLPSEARENLQGTIKRLTEAVRYYRKKQRKRSKGGMYGQR